VAARHPSPGELLRRQTASSPLADPLAALDPEAWRALAGDLDQALAGRVDDGLAFPLRTWLATAHRQG
jgi:hypothetical protein